MRSKPSYIHRLFLLLIISGCATTGSDVVPGATQSAVRTAWGAPTAVRSTTDGERWVYSTAPEGRTVQLLDFDRAGRLQSNVQGLTGERIAQITTGQTRSDVETLIGPSYYTTRYPLRPDEIVHVYRYMAANIPTCFYVGYDTSKGTVSSTAQRDEDRREKFTNALKPC